MIGMGSEFNSLRRLNLIRDLVIDDKNKFAFLSSRLQTPANGDILRLAGRRRVPDQTELPTSANSINPETV